MPQPNKTTGFDLPAATGEDLYPNAGDSYDTPPGAYYPGLPKEREEAEKEEVAAKSASLPILPEIAEWFQEQIARTDSVDNIKIDEMTLNGVRYSRKLSVEAQVLAFQLLKARLIEKAKEFDDFAQEHSQ